MKKLYMGLGFIIILIFENWFYGIKETYIVIRAGRYSASPCFLYIYYNIILF